ncbi:MAG: uracil phosphoribosyltransferase [Bacteroidia bacterium]|jgi:uracil phosphoribosyltransferase
MINILGNHNSIFNQFVLELRDVTIQKDSMRFRRNIERIGEVIAYELSKKLTYTPRETTTPLGTVTIPVVAQQPVVASILRAGLPLHIGVLNYFDGAQNAFISAYRKHHKDHTFEIHVEYMSSPSLEGKTLILCDPMLATGQSMVLAYEAMLKNGVPAQLHVAVIIASAEGLDYARKHLPANTQYWIGAVDEELTTQSYIVPGLGDAGDLAYGSKL